MITINTLQISNDKQSLSVDVQTTGATITSVKLWTKDTFKDYTKAINLDAKLAGVDNTETFTITANDINVNEYDGLYFIEFTDNNGVIKIGQAAELTRYKQCLLDNTLELLNSDIDMLKGEGCPESDYIKLINLQILLNALQAALLSGYYGESIDIIKAMDKFCKTCEKCPNLQSILSLGISNNNIIII